MGFANRYDGIDDNAVWIIRHKARQLVGSAGFSESDREDVEQEMMLDLLRRLPKYDPDRAQRSTFIARIVEHKVAAIIEARTAGKRDRRLCTASLNDRIESGEGGGAELMEVYDLEKYMRRMGRLSRPSDERLDLSVDLGRAVASLPPELRTLCERLQKETVTEISRDMGIPRGTLYERIKEVRRLFEDAGLRDYL